MKFILTIIVLIVLKSNSSFAESKKTYCKFSFKESVYTTIYSCSPKDITITKKEYDKISSQIRDRMNERRLERRRLVNNERNFSARHKWRREAITRSEYYN